MTTANKLTLVRMAMIPVMLVFLIFPEIPLARLWAALVFIVAGITDILDGCIARKTGTVTDFGKVFDPITDKLLVIAAMLPLVANGTIHWGFALVIVGRELLVGGLRTVAASKGTPVISASKIAKGKTLVTDIALAMALLQDVAVFSFFRDWYITLGTLCLATVLTVWSMVDYFLHNPMDMGGKT
ncbi:MAG: CDP-diacylglycerol--glycerol-3-phosphate 3-phosphatidyltransferase [Christensenellales bacterium]